MNNEPLKAAETHTLEIPWRPFVWAALVWAVIGSAVVFGFSKEDPGPALPWFFWLASLATLGLTATAKLFAAVFPLLSGDPLDPKKRIECVIRASSWGTIKLVSWGLTATQLLYSRSIPVPALLLGLGTVIVIPLLGGASWHFDGLRNARRTRF